MADENSLPTGEDHPRRCGEHGNNAILDVFKQGSSPQMRGARPISLVSSSRGGIIPADAGSTKKRSQSQRTTEDHPRRCGEHSPFKCVSVYSEGSSPQMRGAPDFVGFLDEGDRIIPADAGSTAFPASRSSWKWDHPRRCGEHFNMGPILESMGGSSPQMRGAHSGHGIKLI